MKLVGVLFVLVALFTGKCVFAQQPIPWGSLPENADLAVLATRHPPEGTPASKWYYHKDRILSRIVRRTILPPDIVGKLVEIANANDGDRVTREYIVQYLQLGIYGRVSEAERAAIRDCIARAISRPEDGVAGTAVLALSRLAETDPAVTPMAVEAAATSILTNKAAGAGAMASALQVLSTVNMERAEVFARDNTKLSPVLTRSANAVIAGSAGGPGACLDCPREETSP